MNDVKNEPAYLNMLQTILDEGKYRRPAGEEGRFEIFGHTLKFDLSGMTLPLMTTKKVLFKSLAAEMLWFLGGSQYIQPMTDAGVNIWKPWANAFGCVGPLYGYQWRHWHVEENARDANSGSFEIDQMAEVMKTLRDRPEARSHVVTAWRPDHTKLMAIKPCHMLFQFYRYGDEISLILFQRSCDAFA